MLTRSSLLAPLLLLLCTVSLTAQEYRYEVGGYVGAASYLGEANRRIPFVPIGGTGGAAFRYNHNFRLAFLGELGYSYLPFDCRYAQTDYPQVRRADLASRGASHLISLDGWVEYNFAHYSDKYRYLQTRSLVPYIGAGLSVGTTLAARHMAVLPGAGIKTGIKYKLHNRLNLIAALQGIYYISSHLDTPTDETAWLNNPYGMPADWIKGGDALIGLTVSITYEFGKRSEPCHGADYANWQTPR